MSKKCRAYSESRLGLEPSDNRKAFYAGWDAALRERLAEQPAQQESEAIHAAWMAGYTEGERDAIEKQTAQQQKLEPVTVLPDGSAFAVMSYPLPKDHWLYAERQYNEGADKPVELGKPILTHELRNAVVSAVRYAIRGATNCGKEVDFDPDALVRNAVYALCGPFTSPPASKPWMGLSTSDLDEIDAPIRERGSATIAEIYRAIEAKLREKNA